MIFARIYGATLYLHTYIAVVVGYYIDVIEPFLASMFVAVYMVLEYVDYILLALK